jgi:pilus assembly protein Flp/PilA
MTIVSISLWAQGKMGLTSPVRKYTMQLEVDLFLFEHHRRTLMRDLKHALSSLLSDESGQDLIEYALVAALIALGATAAMSTLATTISSAFTTVGTKLTNAI